MNFCTKCGNKLNDTESYCTNCGAKIKEDIIINNLNQNKEISDNVIKKKTKNKKICNNCNSEFNSTEDYCTQCGTKLSLREISDSKNGVKVSVVSIILFICSISIITFSLYYDPTGFLIAAAIFMFAPVLLASIILSIIAIVIYYKKNNKNNNKIKKSRKIFNIINILQIIVFTISIFDISTTIGMLQSFPSKIKMFQSYNINYKTIDICWNADSGGTNEVVSLIKLKKQNRYSLYYHDKIDNQFFAAYNGLEAGANINLDKYFNGEYYSLIFIEKGAEYPFTDIYLGIIVDRENDDEQKLWNIINKFYDDYGSTDYDDLSVDIYVTDKIDYSQSDKYDLFLISQVVDGCKDDFFNIYNDNLVHNYYYSAGKNFVKDYYDYILKREVTR